MRISLPAAAASASAASAMATSDVAETLASARIGLAETLAHDQAARLDPELLAAVASDASSVASSDDGDSRRGSSGGMLLAHGSRVSSQDETAGMGGLHARQRPASPVSRPGAGTRGGDSSGAVPAACVEELANLEQQVAELSKVNNVIMLRNQSLLAELNEANESLKKLRQEKTALAAQLGAAMAAQQVQ